MQTLLKERSDYEQSANHQKEQVSQQRESLIQLQTKLAEMNGVYLQLEKYVYSQEINALNSWFNVLYINRKVYKRGIPFRNRIFYAFRCFLGNQQLCFWNLCFFFLTISYFFILIFLQMKFSESNQLSFRYSLIFRYFVYFLKWNNKDNLFCWFLACWILKHWKKYLVICKQFFRICFTNL